MLPEAIYVSRENVKKDIKNYTVMLIGCGIGTDENAKNDFMDFIE